jgi:hypothetical protein
MNTDETQIFAEILLMLVLVGAPGGRALAMLDAGSKTDFTSDLFFRADRGSIAFALAFFGRREVVRRFFAFAVSNSNLPACREH